MFRPCCVTEHTIGDCTVDRPDRQPLTTPLFPPRRIGRLIAVQEATERPLGSGSSWGDRRERLRGLIRVVCASAGKKDIAETRPITKRWMFLLWSFAFLLGICVPPDSAAALVGSQRDAARPQSQRLSAARVTILALPGTVVSLNDVRRGTTDAQGRLVIAPVEPGRYRLRATKLGRRDYEASVQLRPAASVRVKVVQPLLTDAAERARQRADDLREKKAHEAAVAEYTRALTLRRGPFPRARVGMARSLLALERYDEAATQARRALRETGGRSVEARVVLANILRAQGLYEEAIAEYRRALQRAGNFSPEAHTGLALALEEMSEVTDAIAHLRLAIHQSADTEPILYYLLGKMLQGEDKTSDAIAAYEKYLELAPQSDMAPAIRSIVEQLRKELKPKGSAATAHGASADGASSTAEDPRFSNRPPAAPTTRTALVGRSLSVWAIS